MPATKIESGVLIELKRLVLTPTARKHNPVKIAFWPETSKTPMHGLSPYEKLKVMLNENKEREETTPLDEARLYRAMMDTETGLNQEKLAQKLGMQQGTLSQYMSLTKLDPKVQEIIDRSINLGLRHLLQICRLETPEDHIELAKKANEGDWTVKELKAAVEKRFKPSPPPSPSSGESARRAGEGEVDPLSDFWPQAQAAYKGPLAGSWQVEWKNGSWAFLIKPPDQATAVNNLGSWILGLNQVYLDYSKGKNHACGD